MSIYADRLAALREQLKADRLDGFVVPLTDEHMSEYVGSYAQRLAWLTGFEGSAGSAVVLPRGSGDLRRRALHAPGPPAGQRRPSGATSRCRETSIADWLKEHAPEGARIGYDPWLHTRDWVQEGDGSARRPRAPSWSRSSATRSTRCGPTGPSRRRRSWSSSPTQYAGKSSAEKRHEIADWLAKQDADAAVLSALDSIAWTFNVRGAGRRRTRRSRWPMRWSTPTAPPTCSSPARRSAPTSAQHLGNGVRLHERDEFEAALGELDGQDASRSIPSARSRRSSRRSTRPARKILAAARPDDPAQGDQEPGRDRRPEGGAGARRRGDRRASSTGSTSEAPKGERRRADRRPTSSKRCAARIGELRDLSFDTISGAGPNGAIVHYRSSEKTNRKLEPGTLYLVDSGGQYRRRHDRHHPHRRRSASRPHEMRDRFTRVLKGHIAIATALFPKGTRGSQLDSFARRPLWEAGLDYAHGTGHGVGSFLSVHEGPQRISPVGQRAGGRRRAAAGGHDPFQRARLLQDRRIRHPHRESGAGRRQARSRARRRRCSASRR